ncbi:MAG: hypothetical protein P8N02_04660 [Actinomycetota bacterium]|nr:hypothetical protein [Actinomycetota bacterium]
MTILPWQYIGPMDTIGLLHKARLDVDSRLRLVESGMFGEGSSGSVADDAPVQTRYLDIVGRRP